MEHPDDLCPRPQHAALGSTRPHAEPIYLSSVYECESPRQADALLAGREPGYVYARDGHPNAQSLAEKCRALHGTSQAIVTSTGMSALALVLLAELSAGDHVLVSDQLYGRSEALFTAEAARLGISHALVDVCQLDQVRAALRPQTRLVVVETISNPLLRVADLAALAELSHAAGAALLVDNTFAGPTLCRPAGLGADWVMESLTKSMNGHSDVVLGLVCGATERWARIPSVQSTWGLAPAPLDCWLAMRGLATLALRAERAGQSALAAAQFLAGGRHVDAVYYPGLPGHPDHALATRQFNGRFGSMVSFNLAGGEAAAETFIRTVGAQTACPILFCPSLGEVSTTLSHPESTSHRGVAPRRRAALGITPGTIRLSLGIESAESVLATLAAGLAALD